MEQKTKTWLTAIGLILGGIALYKVSSGKKPSTAIKESVQTPIKVVEAAAKTVTRFAKGSPEAKAHMAKLRSMPRKSKAAAGRKGGNATAKLGKHKGHSTKAGLAQDQKLSSNESHEKHYRQTKDHKGFDQRYK